VILLASEEATNGVLKAISLLIGGHPVLDALEEGIKEVETDPSIISVGLNGLPNALGYVELDAGMMDGRDLKSGSVGGITGFLHPISVARKVLELLPHELLVGRGAEMFASEIGLEKVAAMKPAPADSKVDRPNVQEPLWQRVGHYMRQLEGHDTVIFLGKDAHRNIAAGASTSGLAKKYPGRVGDSAVVGAGFYASNSVGAVGCTGIGEMSMRLATARSTISYMEEGASVESAVTRSLENLRALKDGFLGGITVFAIDREENHFVGTINRQSKRYFLWTDSFDLREPAILRPVEFA
jgi:L-asparaginase